MSSLTEDDHELEYEPGEEEGALVELDAEHDEDVGQDADGVEHQQHGEHHVERRPESNENITIEYEGHSSNSALHATFDRRDIRECLHK